MTIHIIIFEIFRPAHLQLQACGERHQFDVFAVQTHTAHLHQSCEYFNQSAVDSKLLRRFHTVNSASHL